MSIDDVRAEIEARIALGDADPETGHSNIDALLECVLRDIAKGHPTGSEWRWPASSCWSTRRRPTGDAGTPDMLPGWQVEWEAWCVWDGATGTFETGWYPAVSETHARELSTNGRIRTRITYPPTPWTEQ